MNLINNITASSYELPFTSFKPDSKFTKYQGGWPNNTVNTSIDLEFDKLSKPYHQPVNLNNEIPSLKFENYIDSQQTLLLNLYNHTDIYFSCDTTLLKTVTGTVTKNNQTTPNAEVRLHDKISGKIIKKVFSDSNGYFIFTDVLFSRDWYIVAFDSKGEMNAVVLSGIRT